MEIKNINYLNLDTLYDIVIDKFYDQNFKEVKFGKNFSRLLNHVAITLELDNITQYEYIFLKMFCTNITKFENAHIDMDEVNNKYPEISDSFSKWTNLLSSMENDNNKFNIFRSMVPMGLIFGNTIVTLSGEQIASIISLEPRDFFIKASKNKCIITNQDPSKNKLDPQYKSNIYNDDDVKNYIISEFINSFYKFLLDKSTSIDLASDSYNFNRFLITTKNNIKLLNLRNPYMMIDFSEDSTDYIINKLKEYKSINKQKKFTIENTYFEISICSDLSVFFELFELLPLNKFNVLESLSIPSSESLKTENIPYSDELMIQMFNYDNRYKGTL